MDSNTNPRPDRELVSMRVTLSTPDGPIRGQVEVDTGPMRLTDLVPTTLELTDIIVARATRKVERSGARISCRAGCGACCRQMVCLSIPECLYLVEFIDRMPEAARSAALLRFAEIEHQLAEKDLLAPLLDDDYNDDRALQIAHKYFFMNMPCPFLVEESCSIHLHRPVVCRDYNVTSPAELCVDPVRNPVVRVPMPQPLTTPLARLTAELTETKTRLIPLSLAPRWVADHADLRKQTWPGRELFERFLKLLSELPSE